MTLTQTITVESHDWKTRGQKELYPFPDSWDIREYFLPAAPCLTDTELAKALRQPFPYKGSKRTLADLIRGRKQIAILFDDLSRLTPTYRILPPVLDTIQAAGIPNERVRLICAMGSHQPMTDEEMGLKLGADVVRRYAVRNHDSFSEDVVDLGTNSYGTSIRLNRTVMESDLIIGTGMIEKHRFAYASGGAKIVMPGAAHVDSIRHNHEIAANVGAKGEATYGPVRAGINEAAAMVTEKTDFVTINVTTDGARNITHLYLGDSVDMFTTHVDEALAGYKTVFRREDYPPDGRADVAVFHLDTLDPLQLSKALVPSMAICRTRIFVGNFLNAHIYQGQYHGTVEQYLQKHRDVAPPPNPSLEEVLEAQCPVMCSPNIDIKSMHMWKQAIHATHDWKGLIERLFERLGPDRTVAFVHDAYLQTVVPR
ncbi:MAG: DUF2088 domain-containing protein [Kiritimatiellae bacterium]|nr:DUF2088 domain-containing protein [Kiritimatiellia bacterium]